MSKQIAQGVRIIRPFKRQPSSMRTLEGSLYQNGYNFIPGTVRKFFPRVDSRGVIRTGLDENSPKFRGILDTKAREQEDWSEVADDFAPPTPGTEIKN